MRRALLLAAFAAFAAFLTGCATVHAPVPVVGTDAGIASLQGAWEGSYSSPDTRRSGSIFFDLTADADTAAGEVVMVPFGPIALARPHEPGRPTTVRRPSEVLTIRFVRIGDGGLVWGTLDPYTDPECGCTLVTTFEGTVYSDVIEGTFESCGLEHRHVSHGTWRVARLPMAD